MIFSPAEYTITQHLKEQFKIRVGEATQEEIMEMIQNGTVILDTNTHRYIRYKNLRFPCIRTSPGKYYVKSVIVEGMYMNPQ